MILLTAGYRNFANMTTDDPPTKNEGAKPAQGRAVTLFELTDPVAAGDDMEVLDQDIVHLGSGSFSARRVLVNLDKSMFVYHSSSHRARTRTRIHPALMALLSDHEDVRDAAHKDLLEWYLAALQVGEHSEPTRVE